MNIPPPRYRIVERGRRLEVIDTRTGAMPTRRDLLTTTRPPGRQTTWPATRKVAFDGTADLTTQRFYDDKAPRTIRLSPDRAALVSRLKLGAIAAPFVLVVAAIAWPWLVVLPVILASDGVRKPARRAITGWLDQAERESA